MKYQEKSREDLLALIEELKHKYNALEASHEKDIAGRQETEKKLRDSEERFMQVADRTGVWIWEVDASGLYTYASPVVEKILGYTPEEIVGKKRFYEFFNSENAEETKKIALQFFDSKQALKELINQNVHKDGSLIWLSTSANPILDSNGELLGYRGADTDISERRKAEESLKESEFFFKESQKAASIGSYKGDFINGSWESSEILDQIFGIDKDFERSIPGWFDIVYPGDREIMNTYLEEEVKAKQKPFNKEYRIVRKNDNQIRWVLGNGKVEFDDEGNLTSMIGTIQDVTERRYGEDEIRKLNNAVNATSEIVFMTDIEGKFIYVNPAFTEVYGFEPEEVVSLVTPRILKSGKMKDVDYENFWKELLNKQAVQGELINKTKDEKFIYVESASNVITNETGEVVGFMAIQKDITERKQIEEELVLAKEKAEESDHLKTAFLSNMSHEIRTPMNGILGFSELLKKQNLSQDEVNEYIQAIQISGKRMINTINSIIDVSKIESGLTILSIEKTNINAKIEFIYKFFKPESENKGLKLLFKTPLSVKDAVVETDNEKVYGILTNLIKNAIKFTNEGTIEFGYEKKGEFLEYFVKDTGIGIQQDHQEMIFERFRQGSESYNRSYDGSGLGLSISKSYVEMLGGEIWVESEEGKGSAFYFTIPYKPTIAESPEIIGSHDDKEEDIQLRKLKILIVEDDEISRVLLTKRLENISNELLHAATGIEAIDACKNNPDIDLVLMDIQMPKMNGYAATYQIRQFNTEVIIIAQTAHALSGDSKKAIASGCNDYISKPIDEDKLLALIQKFFKK